MFQRKIQALHFIASCWMAVPCAYALPEKDTGNIGEIRQSILEPEDFFKIYGNEWVLMMGQDVDAAWDLKPYWNDSKLPDARGVFLRSTHRDRPEGGNPSGNLVCGATQADEVGSHGHTGRTHGGDARPYRVVFGGAVCGTGRGFNHEPGWSAANGGVCDYNDNLWTGADHTHQLNIDASTGSETRPRCVIVNTYIKVSRTKENAATQVVLDAVKELPATVANNPRLAQVIRELVADEVKKQIAEASKSATKSGSRR